MNPWLTLVRLGQKGGMGAFEAACRHPERVQEQVLLRHVRRHRDTEYGKQHGFRSVESIDDFRQRVTINGYDFFSPYIDRMLHGQRNVLTPEKVDFWNATAGTTGWRKLFPITATHMRDLRTTMHLWVEGALRDHTHVVDGETLHFAAPARVDMTSDGTPIGNISGYNYNHVPTPISRRYAVPWQTFEPRDGHVRTYLAARLALRRPVTWLFSISSHPLQQLFEALRRDGDLLLKDLHDGTLSVDVPSEIRRALVPWLKADPEAARAIRERVRFAGALTPRAVWPGLQLLSCWTHGPGAAFLPEILAEVPGAPVRGPTYAASEGWFSIPLSDGDAAGVLALHGNFFEFVGLDEDGNPNGPPLMAHELLDGRRYSMVITNGTGLSRYRLDDVVQVDGYLGRTPRIRYVYKLGSALNLGEGYTTELQARTSLEKAAADLHVEVKRWALAVSPVRAAQGQRRYTFLLERGAGGADVGESVLAGALERALCEANPGYQRARRSGMVAPLSVSRVAQGGFAQVLEQRVGASHAADSTRPVLLIRENAVRDLFDVELETAAA